MKPKATLSSDPWSLEPSEITERINVNPQKGLSRLQIRKNRQLYGANMLKEVKPKSALTILINQFKNLIVFFLVTAALVSFIFGDHVEGFAIAVVIVINAVIGFVTELKGARSIEALRKLGSVSSRVRRNGKESVIPAKALVVGDIVILEGGDIVTADLRIISGSKLQSNESVLTGESLPVSKDIEKLPAETLLADRANMLFKGTALTRGAGEAVVVATGMGTYLGKISSVGVETLEEDTPLEKRLNQLGNWLIWVSLGLAAMVSVAGIMSGKDMLLMIETGIALAVASIPEGLPIVATIALARGVWRMARRNALIKELSAVETLGATSIICTDKTGTLTENRLTAVEFCFAQTAVNIDEQAESSRVFVSTDGEPLSTDQSKVLQKAIELSVLCNNAELGEGSGGAHKRSVGDPLEIALLSMGAAAGVIRKGISSSFPEEKEVAFDSEIKMMATYHRIDSGYRVAVKGAPEGVLESCLGMFADGDWQKMSDKDRQKWTTDNEEMAARGLRVLAFAEKEVTSLDEEPYSDLKLVGLVGLMDPPREDVKEVLKQCKDAGIRVIMATGDQPVSARAIGRAVGLVDEEDAMVVHGSDLKKMELHTEEEKKKLAAASLFARVSPAQKLDLIELHRERGAIVAMTGDGVNDAPALKKADIGIAMGKRGTQVAREAAEMILKDDSFSSIVHAVRQGRIIFKNIRAFVRYLLSCNLSEIMTVSFAAFLGLPLPLLPLQILFLNIVTDVFPALALAAGEGNPRIMENPPRSKNEPIMTPKHWIEVSGYGLMITIAVLGAFFIALEVLNMTEKEAITISFLTLAFAQLWHVFNMRERGSSFTKNAMVKNPFIWGALALCTCLLMLTIHVPLLSTVLKVEHPGMVGMALVLGMSFLPLILGQILASLRPSTN